MNTQEHIRKVQDWLDENVRVYETPETVTVCEFVRKLGAYSGSFHLRLDDVALAESFSFGLGNDGRPELFFPVFHSPLGAPASYSAVRLTQETVASTENLLGAILPKMKPLGLNRETDEMVFATTHSELDRVVVMSEYKAAMARIFDPDFEASIPVSSPRRA